MKRSDRGFFLSALFSLALALLMLYAPAGAAQQPTQNPVPPRYFVLDYMKKNRITLKAGTIVICLCCV